MRTAVLQLLAAVAVPEEDPRAEFETGLAKVRKQVENNRLPTIGPREMTFDSPCRDADRESDVISRGQTVLASLAQVSTSRWCVVSDTVSPYPSSVQPSAESELHMLWIHHPRLRDSRSSVTRRPQEQRLASWNPRRLAMPIYLVVSAGPSRFTVAFGTLRALGAWNARAVPGVGPEQLPTGSCGR